MVDKLLLGLLVLILPIGLLVVNLSGNGDELEDEASDGSTIVTVDNLEQILTEAQQGAAAKVESAEAEKFNITAVVYASDSGQLEVSGLAPGNKMSVQVSATVLPVSGQADGDEGVLGQEVETWAVALSPGQTSFRFVYPVEEAEGVLELVFVQGSAVEAMQVDLKTGERL